MSDLIDREKFIYTLIFSEKTKSIFVKDLRNVIEVANEMPSAESESKWIPCSERLPLLSEHVDDMVLVCYGNGSIRFDSCMNGEWVHGNPIAWMQLPEPWRGEE